MDKDELVKLLNKFHDSDVYDGTFFETRDTLMVEYYRLGAERDAAKWNADESMLQYNQQQERTCKAEAERDGLKSTLKDIEWIFDEDSEAFCPVCNNMRDLGGHATNCKLAAALNPPSEPKPCI